MTPLPHKTHDVSSGVIPHHTTFLELEGAG